MENEGTDEKECWAKTELTNDPDGRPHREDRGDGQQRAYVVLSEEERKKGFVRPLRTAYVHSRCKTVTRINSQIAETYARQPDFYSGTFCVACQSHYDLEEFTWDGTDEKVGS